MNSGRLEELKSLLEEDPERKKKLVLAKDDAGVGLIHKAVYYDLKDIYKYLIENYPHVVHLRDAVSYTNIFIQLQMLFSWFSLSVFRKEGRHTTMYQCAVIGN